MTAVTGMNGGVSSSRAATSASNTSRPLAAGLFRDREQAVAAIDALKGAGFDPQDVGVAMRDRDAQGALIEETGTRAPEGAATGAVGGGVLGGLLGWLVGIGALAIPGIGPVVAGGALATAFGLAGGTAVAGAGIGALTGGIAGALIGLGIPEEEARYYEQGLREGGVLVTVRGGQRDADAQAILDRHGATTRG